MTPEDRFERIERQIEFIVGQQATQAERLTQLGDYLLRTARLVEDFARRTEEKFVQLADGQAQLLEALRRTDAKIEQLTDAQRRTDERLNILISVVERYFSNGKR